MNETIKIQAIGQGVSGQFLKNKQDWLNLCLKIEINGSMCEWLWNDHFYGVGNPNLYEPWVRWLYLGQKQSGNAIVNYFGLDGVNIEQLRSTFQGWCQSVEVILDDWYCKGETCK